MVSLKGFFVFFGGRLSTFSVTILKKTGLAFYIEPLASRLSASLAASRPKPV